MKLLIGKLIYSLFTVFLAITTVFFVFRLAPGDPVERILGPEASVQEIMKYREVLGLNLPISHQYFNFLKDATRGDFGQSLYSKKLVIDLLKIHMPPTFILALISIFISSIVGILLGTFAAHYNASLFDKILRPVVLIILAFPIFSLAPLLVLFFSLQLHLLPVSEWDGIRHAILPILTLVLPLSCILMRVTRNKLLEEASAPWLMVLKAKGLGKIQIVLRHLKVSLPTILNIIGIQLSVVLAGTMVTETIFDIPGMGSLLFEGIQNRDYPVVQGVIIYSTAVYMLVYFLVDLVNSKIDPRIEGL